MAQRIVLLSHLVPSISWESVWRLPWWLWQGYAAFVDQWISARNAEAAELKRLRG